MKIVKKYWDVILSQNDEKDTNKIHKIALLFIYLFIYFLENKK